MMRHLLRHLLSALALVLALAVPASAQEQHARNFGVSFRWCNGPVVDRVLTSDQLAALGLPIPLTIVGAGIGWTPAPGPWPSTGDAMIAVDVGTAFWNSAKNFPPGQQNGPIERLNLLAYVIIGPGQPMQDIREFAHPVVLRAGDALLFDYNCTGDPYNYTVGVNFAFNVKYLLP